MTVSRAPSLAALLVFATGGAWAGGTGALRADAAWIRVLPGDLPAAAYLTLRNAGDEEVALTGARSASYRRIMLHRSAGVGGMEGMVPVARLPVPAHGAVRLAPGGYHLMLMDAVRPIAPGRKVTLTLIFDGGREKLDVAFLARPANATGP
ncbi:MAG: copper chaperone PCu(A)C [Gammaproteobacteria bacterium]|nr:copper chaperone PCu(A)C [Gammaproteobacteria bacterium]